MHRYFILNSIRFFISVVIQVTLLMAFAPTVGLAGDATTVSCDCPEPKCSPCEEETGVEFYTEKCGPSLSRVKSCKRRQCIPVQDQEVCLAKLNGTPTVATSPRSVASEAKPVSETPRSAEVILALGQAFVQRARMSLDMKEPLSKGMLVFVGDRIITQEDGRVRIRFPELSEIFVSPQTTLLMTEALVEKRPAGPAKRTILLDLAKGRVRSRVQGFYNDGESKFEVKTRSAVAGVRGTHFVVSFEPGEQSWKTEVRTITGEVSLDGRGSKRLHASVTAEGYATHTVPAPADGASSFEIDAAIERDQMSEVMKMSPADISELLRVTDVSLKSEAEKALAKAGRDPSADGSLCRSPAGSFNQCAWTCEGSGKGAKSCRTDQPGVRCVRRLCRANGQWGEATVLPTKQGVNCEPAHTIVGDCGGYW